MYSLPSLEFGNYPNTNLFQYKLKLASLSTNENGNEHFGLVLMKTSVLELKTSSLNSSTDQLFRASPGEVAKE